MAQEEKYSTGQIKKIFGLSRDALRYYEKKAIIEPEQKDNSYREYNKWDIYTLLVMDFYKKRSLSIKQIRKLQAGSTLAEVEKLLQSKQEELRESIRKQKQMLKRIQETDDFCKTLESHLNHYCYKNLPLYEIQMEFSDWFAFSEYQNALRRVKSEDEDMLTHMMRYVAFNETQVLDTKMYVVKKVQFEQKDNHKKYIKPSKCMYTIVEDGRFGNIPDNIIPNVFASSKKWAYEHGVKLVGTAFANTRLITYCNKKERVFIEIYIPIL
jgi:DNA-binding transcriptional MerR regulator